MKAKKWFDQLEYNHFQGYQILLHPNIVSFRLLGIQFIGVQIIRISKVPGYFEIWSIILVLEKGVYAQLIFASANIRL